MAGGNTQKDHGQETLNCPLMPVVYKSVPLAARAVRLVTSREATEAILDLSSEDILYPRSLVGGRKE